MTAIITTSLKTLEADQVCAGFSVMEKNYSHRISCISFFLSPAVPGVGMLEVSSKRFAGHWSGVRGFLSFS